MPRERWNKELILALCQKLCKQWRQIPTKALLIKRGHRKLAQYAIPKYFRNFKNLHEALGLPNSRKPPNSWTLKNTVAELRSFCKTHRQVIEASSITTAIYRLNAPLMNAAQRHGGLKKLNRRFKLGIPLRTRKWTRARIIRDLKEIHQAGHLISRKNLLKLGKNGLVWAMGRFENLTAFKREIGIPVRKLRRWTDSAIIKDLKPLIAKHGFFPNSSLLKILGRYDLSRAISNKGGFPKFARLLNASSPTLFPAKDGHYLQSSYECVFDNILFKYNIPHRVHVRISKKHLYKCDFLIGKTYIEIAGYIRSNSNAYEIKMAKKIRLYKKLKKKYIIIPQKVFCQRMEWIEEEALRIISKMGFRSQKPSDSLKEICIKPPTYWASFKNIKKELAPLILKYGRMPTIKELYEAGKATIANAIYKYHGTAYEVAQRLQLRSRQVSREYYTKAKTISDYKQICMEQGKYLTMKELYSVDLKGLAHAIIKYFGFQVARKKCKLGYPIHRIRHRELSHEDLILEYRNVCKRYRRFLKHRELVEYGFSSLAGGLNRHGLSLRTAREQSGLYFISSYLSRL